MRPPGCRTSSRPRQAFKIVMALADMEDDAYVGWDDYLAGRRSVDDLPMLSSLPDWVLFVVNTVWLQRFREVFTDIRDRLEKGGVPYPTVLPKTPIGPPAVEVWRCPPKAGS